MIIVELVVEAQAKEYEVSQQRKLAAGYRKSGDILKRLKADPADVQLLYGRANQIDAGVVQLQHRLDDIMAMLQIEKTRLEIERTASQTSAS